MIGMSRHTGARLGGMDHLRQSVADILSTPLGSRVMRRDYGSLLPELVDQPNNDATRVRVYAATAAALMRWEPRIRVQRVSVQQASSAGSRQALVIDIEGEYLPAGEGAAHGVNLNAIEVR